MREKEFLISIFCFTLMGYLFILERPSDPSQPAFFCSKLFILANFRGFLFPWVISQSEKINNDEEVDSVFGQTEQPRINKGNSVTQPPARSNHFVFHRHSGANHSIFIHSPCIGEKWLKPNDEIGVFTLEGLCVGATSYSGVLPIVVTAWSDDPRTLQKDGYHVGERMFFSHWDSDKKKEYAIRPRFLDSDSTFASSAYSRISRLQAIMPHRRGKLTLQNVCRSSDGTARMTIHLPQDGIVRLTLYEVKNQRIKDSLEEYKKSGKYSVVWRTAESADGVYVLRAEAAKSVNNLKLVLVN